MRKLIAVVLVVLLLAPLANALATSEEEVAALAGNLDTFSLELLQVIQEEVEKAIQRKQSGGAQVSIATLGLVPSNRMTPEKLFDAYDSNSISADAKYKGAIFEIAGYINSIDQESFLGDRIYITITTTNSAWDFDAVMCFLNESERDKVVALSKDDRIAITGTGDGMSWGSFSMKDCAIIQESGTRQTQTTIQAAAPAISATPFPKDEYPPLVDYMTFVWTEAKGEAQKALLDCTIVSMGPGPSEVDTTILYDTDMKGTMRIRFPYGMDHSGLKPGDRILVYALALEPLVKSREGGQIVEAYVVEAQHFEKIK